jgi:hypothetical protein
MGGLCSRKYFPSDFWEGWNLFDFTGVFVSMGFSAELRRLQLRAEAPLGAGVGDAETLALGIALGIAARHGPHHCEIASMFESVTHAFVKQRSLQAAPPQLRNGRRAAKQGHSVMDAERARREIRWWDATCLWTYSARMRVGVCPPHRKPAAIPNPGLPIEQFKKIAILSASSRAACTFKQEQLRVRN